MLTFDIPGREPLTISQVVFDYNGTLALDGIMMPEVRELIPKLAKVVKVYVITADTFGLVRKECEGLPVEITVFPRANAGKCKEEIVRGLTGGTACVGNGNNDIPMCDAADLSIAVINEETMCAALLNHVDVFAPSIRSAIELFLKPGRLVATLRN